MYRTRFGHKADQCPAIHELQDETPYTTALFIRVAAPLSDCGFIERPFVNVVMLRCFLLGKVLLRNTRKLSTTTTYVRSKLMVLLVSP